jgi:hypothetical protein
MKLNERETALHFLYDGHPARVAILPNTSATQEAMKFMKYQFPAMRPRFRKKIQYISRPFMKAFLKGVDKLSISLLEEPVKQSGTFVFPEDETFTQTIFYDLESKIEAGELVVNGKIAKVVKHRSMPLPMLIFYTTIQNNDAINFIGPELLAAGIDNHCITNDTLTMILFTKFCEVETKIVPPGKKTIHANEKYVNETKLPIEILDSTWFTTIVRSEGFMVGGETGGFFRWQRCGPGLSDKKYIWVAPFQKNGYTRKAKVLLKTD